MLFCTSFRQGEEILQQIDEIRFPFSNIDLALEYIATHDNIFQKVIVEIRDWDLVRNFTTEKMQSLLIENPNLYFDFFKINDFTNINTLVQVDNPRFLYHIPINTYVELKYLMSFKQCYSITIGEPLLFDLPNVYKTAHRDEGRFIKLRCYPVLGKPSRFLDFKEDNGICHFWVLPQHVHLYEDYIDVFELLDTDILREKQLCKYFIEDKEYLLNMRMFIKNIDTPMIGNFVDEEWVQKRIKCCQVCFVNKPGCKECIFQDRMYRALLKRPELIEKKVNSNGTDD